MAKIDDEKKAINHLASAKPERFLTDRVADPGGVDPDPVPREKTDPNPTVKEKKLKLDPTLEKQPGSGSDLFSLNEYNNQYFGQ